jgi:hypothetical protein
VEKGYLREDAISQGYDSDKLALDQPSMSQKEFESIVEEFRRLTRELHPDNPFLK